MDHGDATESSASTSVARQHRMKAIWPSVFSLVVLLGLVGYLYLNADELRDLLDLSVSALLSVVGLVLVSISVKGLINYLFYRQLGASQIKLNEGLGLAVINTVSNQLPFAGGLIAKGVYLKSKYQVAYTRYVSATVAVYVCYVSSTGLVGLGVLAYWFLGGSDVSPLLALGFAGMAASICLIWLPVNLSFLPEKWRKRMAQLADGWQLLKEKPVLLGELVSLQVILTLLAAGRLWITFHALSQDVTLAHCLLFSSASILTRLVSISPGGFGVREAIIASVASVLGFELGVSAVAVSLERLITTPVNIALGVLYAYVLGKQATNAQPELAKNRGEQALRGE